MSASLCGGIGAGPIATGTATNSTTLVLTLTRAIDCNGVIVVNWGALTKQQPFGDSGMFPITKTDTFGHFYYDFQGGAVPFPCFIDAENVSHLDGGGNKASTLENGTAITAATAGDMGIGDTITFTYQSDYPATLEIVGSAYLVTGITVNQASGGQYFLGDSYPDFTSNPTTLNWFADQGFLPTPLVDCAAMYSIVAYPQSGTWTPADSSAVVIGAQTSPNMSLAMMLVPFASSGVGREPGGSWGSSALLIEGNWQFAEFAVIAGPTLRGKYRIID